MGGGVACVARVFVAFGLGGEELVELGEAAVVVGLVDDFFGGLEMVGDGWLVFLTSTLSHLKVLILFTINLKLHTTAFYF